MLPTVAPAFCPAIASPQWCDVRDSKSSLHMSDAIIAPSVALDRY